MDKIKKLGNNQYAMLLDGTLIFQSYETIVCTIEKYVNKTNRGAIKITDGQPQSRTTTKYLNVFLQMFTEYNHYKEVKF